jgi:ubiquinol-cytochrome c reductase cytochrome b subunit
MKQALLAWLDHRTGFRRLLHQALYENIPGGAKWRYVWGSTLVFTFVVQVITGVFLWLAYSPSSNTAWESVYYIEHQMAGGAFVRGLHHFTAQAMVVLLGLHLMQVVIDGAYRAPREMNFWLGLVLMLIVLGLSLTGYLLPWDQKGYWATKVATNLLGLVPLAGPSLQKLVVGGAEYGHHTLTRFFALHAGVLPGLLILCLVLHLALFRRHGIKAHRPAARPDQFFWPEQALRDAVACLAVLAAVIALVVWRGAELGAPADPANEFKAARPEWYFLFLFQFLKLFEGHGEQGELLGAILLPGLALMLMFFMPILGRWRLGHAFNVGYLACLFVGVALLTGMALYEDRGNPQYVAAVEQADEAARHAVELAGKSRRRIPVEGAAWMLENSPQRIFASKCASCHSHVDAEGRGIKAEKPSAPNLHGFASRPWLTRLLQHKQFIGPDFFGNTQHKSGDMAEFLENPADKTGTDFTPEQFADIALALSAEAQLPSQREADAKDVARIQAGRRLIADGERCAQCHKFHEGGELGSAPDLTGYGSTLWMMQFISNPASRRFYDQNNDRMPRFCPTPLLAEENELTPTQIRLVVEWLRGEWEAAEE